MFKAPISAQKNISYPIMLSLLIAFFQQLLGAPDVLAQPIPLDEQKWQFQRGDDMKWATPQYPDQNWQKIAVGKSWEAALGEPYDGFAWYRRTVVVPASQRKAVCKYNQMVIRLGMIDDADETFFNGVKIGATGKFPPESQSAWDVQRIYFVPSELIKYDEPNTIAVRVADWGGGGGLHAGEFSLEAVSWKDKCKIKIKNETETHDFKSNAMISNFVSIENDSKQKIEGTLRCELKTFAGKTVEIQEKKLKLHAKSKISDLKFDFPPQSVGFYNWEVQLIDDKKFATKANFGFAVEPENAVVVPNFPSNFDQFWSDARRELDSIAPKFRVVRKHEKSNLLVEVTEIEMISMGNKRIRGYYSRPKGKKNLPALLRVQGYGSVMEPHDPQTDMAIFYLNIRGHGNSREDVNPGFPGFLLSGLDTAETYIYRAAFMDCIRAVDFLAAQPEIDVEKIGVAGASQGGALSIVTAALDGRIKFCQPDVPFLSDYPNYFQIAKWPAEEFLEYSETQNKPMGKIFEVLNYFDMKNFATRVRVPVFMGVGLFDDVCPPAINFAAFNNMPSAKKTFCLYPTAGHSMPSEQYDKSMKWIREQIKMLR